ncbi:Surface polysaccharide O-acyltransferase, integral membrane enzyme [Duganella sp. CF402]|uniref:acyltransferase family protein n=1 Tax=unclassified Duganella TaxID=2636909 RepID=UPI0008D43B60|nr:MULTISPECIES: acyltransferase family protein [unclassified Duganella]RZT09885.1 surface polysaccharide O-acyltransferase-like enzyme [Duganella sp. BK701]SEL38563.1 Surface polysaccharide O-acyltransferase, integral membrane enzyme [Duganella sp. CF402]
MNNNRLYFLDWIRIFAFCLLIFYHTGMYYVTWDWHVKSPFASNAIEPLMILSSPWRLGLLFMISGVATAFMLKKFRVGALLKQRSWRLLVPLVFGMFVIVPPQAYFEIVEKIAYQGGYAEFMRLYVSGYEGFCRGKDCLDMPTWNHLWFVAYLWVYTMLGGLIVWLLGARFDAVSDALGRLLSGWRLIVLPVAILALARFTLADRFESTHGLVDDWYNHAQYFFLFALGAMLAAQKQLWARMDALRWTSLGLWLASWALIVCYWSIPEALANTPEVQQWKPVFRTIYCLCQWMPILTVCGFGHRHLNFDSAKRRYLTEAVFPVYILHQTLIVAMAHWMKPIKLAPGIEGVFLIVLTFAISFGVFEVVRRIAVLRPLFGLGPLTSQTSAYAAQAPAAAATPGR